MTWKGFAKGLLFCAGMASSVAAGNLFYFGRIVPGSALLVLTALFLFYAMTDLHHTSGAGFEGEGDFLGDASDLRKALADLTVLVAENALNGAKRIGRTLPCTPTEITKLEEDLMPLLSSLYVSRKERERILQEFDKLRTRSRQDEGRRALTGNRL